MRNDSIREATIFLSQFRTNTGETFRNLRGNRDPEILREQVNQKFPYRIREHRHLRSFEAGEEGMLVWELAFYLFELGVWPDAFFLAGSAGSSLPAPRHLELDTTPAGYFSGFKRSAGRVLRIKRSSMYQYQLRQKVFNTFGGLITIPSTTIINRYEMGAGSFNIWVLACCLNVLGVSIEEYFSEVEADRLEELSNS